MLLRKLFKFENALLHGRPSKYAQNTSANIVEPFIQHLLRDISPGLSGSPLDRSSKVAYVSDSSQRGKGMTQRQYEKMTKAEVIAAQRSWAKNVCERNVDALLDLYDFGTADEPLLFKPTLTDVVRLDRAGTRSYFVGGDANYPHDHGFLNRGWKRVEFQSAAGPVLKAGGLGYKDMGHYTFVDGEGNATRADYTFAYHKLDGRVLISLHHSSLTWFPPASES